MRHTNNFDLIRLLAAAQVAVTHILDHFGYWHEGAFPASVIGLFAGVPIFFFISGYLITSSFDGATAIGDYARRRVARIYPEMWFALTCTVAALLLLGVGLQHPLRLAIWMVMQGTVLQTWHPAFIPWFRENALWTIPVELGFYVLLPVLMMLSKRSRAIIPLVAVASFALLWLYCLPQGNHGVINFQKIVRMSPLPWLWMFCIGSLAYRYRDRLIPIVSGRFLYFALAYAAVLLLSVKLPIFGLLGHPRNEMPLLDYLFCSAMILSAAYSAPQLSERLLHRNDFSYGLYLFHMPIVNALKAAGISGSAGVAITLVCAPVMAIVSWFCIGKPALSLKNASLFPAFRTAPELLVRGPRGLQPILARHGAGLALRH